MAFGGAATPLALEAGSPERNGARGKEQKPTLWQFAVSDIAASVAELAARGVPSEGAIKRGVRCARLLPRPRRQPLRPFGAPRLIAFLILNTFFAYRFPRPIAACA